MRKYDPDIISTYSIHLFPTHPEQVQQAAWSFLVAPSGTLGFRVRIKGKEMCRFLCDLLANCQWRVQE